MSDTHSVTYLEGIPTMTISAVQPHNEVGYFCGGQYETTPDFSEMSLPEAREYLTCRGEWGDYRVVDAEVTLEIRVRGYLDSLTRLASTHRIQITEYTADMSLQVNHYELVSLLRRQAPMFVELAFADSGPMAIGHDSGLQLVHYGQVIPLTAVWVHEGMTYEYQTYLSVVSFLDESDILSEERVEQRCRAAQHAAERNKALEDQ